MRAKVLAMLFGLCVWGSALAQDPVEVTHRVVGINNLGDTIQLHIELTIKNVGEYDLSDVALVPEGIEFAGIKEDQCARLKSLPVNGAVTKTWISRSYLAAEYFAHETPLLFLIKAQTQDGDDIRIPVISHDGEV